MFAVNLLFVILLIAFLSVGMTDAQFGRAGFGSKERGGGIGFGRGGKSGEHGGHHGKSGEHGRGH
ncbi:hypothetical protein PRIPAC_77901 [Pristionchus pacificus]|uniref:Uncharacterized protein n=1 Tax=Pristionchus pacificus TaxID=54126 RepID=A0A2A6C2B5_PRIPA|nr:hypothetical protein PRIPAC_77901 [Pristionchus pacificus]|eukprot:PDM72248.1 hypothetical protein PRIPAC_38682 [Pristionchus pacificus]